MVECTANFSCNCEVMILNEFSEWTAFDKTVCSSVVIKHEDAPALLLNSACFWWSVYLSQAGHDTNSWSRWKRWNDQNVMAEDQGHFLVFSWSSWDVFPSSCYFFLNHMTSHLTSSSRVLACFCPSSSGVSRSCVERSLERVLTFEALLAEAGGAEVKWLDCGAGQTRRSQLHY